MHFRFPMGANLRLMFPLQADWSATGNPLGVLSRLLGIFLFEVPCCGPMSELREQALRGHISANLMGLVSAAGGNIDLGAFPKNGNLMGLCQHIRSSDQLNLNLNLVLHVNPPDFTGNIRIMETYSLIVRVEVAYGSRMPILRADFACGICARISCLDFVFGC